MACGKGNTQGEEAKETRREKTGSFSRTGTGAFMPFLHSPRSAMSASSAVLQHWFGVEVLSRALEINTR